MLPREARLAEGCTLDGHMSDTHKAHAGMMSQVSFGVHDEEERAARMYDRAIILEKERAAKTNFPLHDYDREIEAFEAFVAARCSSGVWSLAVQQACNVQHWHTLQDI